MSEVESIFESYAHTTIDITLNIAPLAPIHSHKTHTDGSCNRIKISRYVQTHSGCQCKAKECELKVVTIHV